MRTGSKLAAALFAVAVATAPSLSACEESAPCDKLSMCPADPEPLPGEIAACQEDYKQGGDCAAARDCQFRAFRCGDGDRTDPTSRLQSLASCTQLITKAMSAKCKGYASDEAP